MTTSRDHHDELLQQTGLYVLGALTPSEHAALEAHLAVCAECASEVRGLRVAVEALAGSVAPADPPLAVRRRVLGSATARTSPLLVPWLAAAAAVAVAIALGLYSAQLRSRVRSLEVRLRQAIFQAQASRRETVTARQVVADVQTQIEVLRAPDLAQVELRGQPEAPDASARVIWSRSRGLVLVASNLPLPPSGRTYQLWILTARTAPISDRWLLTPDPAGRATAMFSTPPDLPAPVAVAVTLEPDSGAPAPTGAKYLVGSFN